MDEKQEIKVTASSFIINFYQEVQQLKSTFASYYNTLIQTSQMGDNTADLQKGMDEQTGEAIKTLSGQLRYLITTSYLDYKAMYQAAKKLNKNDKVEKAYKNIREDKAFLVNWKETENYITGLLSFLTAEVMTSLLENSEQFLNSVYGESEQK